ncbi:MAG: thiamine pyrophosphate-binding protein, partial [Dehalococcoidia bacterium]|nr:thiamine pyrophosphate-binding protein [Dehalococcoidia bacterium]
MTVMTGKKALMEMLQAEGIQYIFGNPGTSEGPILDALEDYPDLQYLLTSQEGAAMGMADGYARASGQVSFVNLHIETGLANGLSLLHNAHEGGTPIVVTSANKDVRKLAEGRSDLSEMVRLFTKWSVEVTDPAQIPAVMRRAFTEAKTPPTGPVYIGFSANALDSEADMEIIPSPQGYFRLSPDKDAIKAAGQLLSVAKNPALIVGDRLAQSNGIPEAVRVAELVGAKVYATSYSEMNFPTDHAQFLGQFGAGTPEEQARLAENDVIIAVGTNVFSSFFYFEGRSLSKNAKLIHLDSAQREIGKSEPTDIGIAADPKIGLEELATFMEANMPGSSREEAKGRIEKISKESKTIREISNQHLKDRFESSPMSAERMMHEIASALPANTIIADDSVTSRAAVHSAIPFNQPGSIHGERGGALGWGMGGAL